MKDAQIDAALARLKRAVKAWKVPVVGVFAQSREPFLVLVSCLLSLRTRDAATLAASRRLFSRARTPLSLAKLSAKEIETLIYPVSFYRVKARTLKRLARTLLDEHGGRVPDTLDGLLTLKGVGRKTANLVVTLGFSKPGICVDVHVHRISNRWGYIRTKTPDESEAALRDKLPRRHWRTYNDLLVPFGQNLCTPLSPWCSRCPVTEYCERRGVGRSR